MKKIQMPISTMNGNQIEISENIPESACALASTSTPLPIKREVSVSSLGAMVE